jgi:uncharacterized protein
VILMCRPPRTEDVASFAQRVASLKVGRKERGDGPDLLVAERNARAVQIQVAKALQGAVPDIAPAHHQQQIVRRFATAISPGGLNQRRDRNRERIAARACRRPRSHARAAAAAASGGFDCRTSRSSSSSACRSSAAS